MKSTLLRLSIHVATAIGCVTMMTLASATDAAAQFGGARQPSVSPISHEFVGNWRWATGRQSCGSVLDSFGNKPIVGDGKQDGTIKRLGGNPNLCQFPIDEVEKVMNGRGRLWLKTFSADDAISPKWTCAIGLAEMLSEGTKTFIQRADALVMWAAASETGRYIYTDGRKHPPATDMFYWGHSLGWMEGKTFVVETTNFTWDIDGYDDQSHIARSHLAKWIERYTMKDQDTMEVAYEIEDPVFLRDTFRFAGVLKRDKEELTNSYLCDPEIGAREIYTTFKNKYPDDNTAERFFNVK